MDTAAISYRVADFLKQHPPFQAMEDGDLLELAAGGRVRFHEANDFVVWQGEPHKLDVFVIQQGTVTLWDEADGNTALRDVRGAGDLLGIERFTGARSCLYSVRASSDVVIYAFPAPAFEELVLKYPYARRFVEASATVTADYQGTKDADDPQAMFLHDVVGGKTLEICRPETSVRDVARALLASGIDAMAVVDGDNRVQGVATVAAVLGWVAAGAGSADEPIGALLSGAPPAIGSTASVADAVLAMASAPETVVAVTAEATHAEAASSQGTLQTVVTSRDLTPVFGDQPGSIVHDIRRAKTTAGLSALNRRARAFALRYLTRASSIDWLARFLFLADVEIVKKIIAIAGGDPGPADACWCFCGMAGREESLTRHAPQLVLIAENEGLAEAAQQLHERVSGALGECGYLARNDDSPFERAFHVASQAEWQARYERWLRDPVRARMQPARSFFDLRPVHGAEPLWQDLKATVAAAVDNDFLYVMANDCLASLPPLTFYRGAVVDEAGEETDVFRLEHSALRPLVDVGRVFGMAARDVLGTSTRERFASARRLLPEHEAIFREAAETLRILLWQQARIGIADDTTGSELPPSHLSRYDRHVLKSGFRSILRLLELTGDPAWIAAI